MNDYMITYYDLDEEMQAFFVSAKTKEKAINKMINEFGIIPSSIIEVQKCK